MAKASEDKGLNGESEKKFPLPVNGYDITLFRWRRALPMAMSGK